MRTLMKGETRFSDGAHDSVWDGSRRDVSKASCRFPGFPPAQHSADDCLFQTFSNDYPV